MAKLTDKTELNATPASNDLIHIVDVSDTTSSPQGTSYKMTVANFKADLVPYTGATSDVNLGSNNITANNLSGTNTGDQDLSGLVPYSGATSNVNLGTYNITSINGFYSLGTFSLVVNSIVSTATVAESLIQNLKTTSANHAYSKKQVTANGADAYDHWTDGTINWTAGLDGTDGKWKLSNSASLGTNDALEFDGINGKFYGTVNLNSLTASTPLALNANKQIISNPSKYLIYSALTTQFIANNTPTTVLFPTPDVSTFGTDIAYSAGIFTNNSGETLTLEVSYSVRFNFITAGALYGGRIIISSSTIYYAQSLGHSSFSSATAVTGTSLVQIPNGGTLRIEVYQNSGATRDISIPVGSGASVITIKKV